MGPAEPRRLQVCVVHKAGCGGTGSPGRASGHLVTYSRTSSALRCTLKPVWGAVFWGQ